MSAVAQLTLRDRILEILSQVPDPEIPCVSVVDLGIVREVRGNTLTITPTYTGCPATVAIEHDIRAALDRDGLSQVKIETTLSPPWTTDWISEEGRQSCGPTALRRRRKGQPSIRCVKHRPNAPVAVPRTRKRSAASAPRPARRCTAASIVANPSIASNAIEQSLFAVSPNFALSLRSGDVLEIAFPVFRPRITIHSERKLTAGAHRKYGRARTRSGGSNGVHCGHARERRIHAADRPN